MYMKKKFCVLLFTITLLTSCSLPDTECSYCRDYIVSEDAYMIADNLCCESCYLEANTCEYCGEKFINHGYLSNLEFCEACIDNRYVICCEYCSKYYPKENIIIEPAINDYQLWNVCINCFSDCISEYCGTDFDSTWGDLIESNGGELVWETLTDEQRKLVKYPYLNSNEVFFTPNCILRS